MSSKPSALLYRALLSVGPIQLHRSPTMKQTPCVHTCTQVFLKGLSLDHLPQNCLGCLTKVQIPGLVVSDL